MNLESLKTLVAIAEHGSFAAAARDLDLSQSAISMQIQTLEREFGSALFDRSKRPPVLTDEGVSAVARARDILGRCEELRTMFVSSRRVEGRLLLGAVGSALTGLLPVALTAIRRRHPGLHIEVVSGFSEELLHQVGRRRLDAALVSDYDGGLRDLDWRPFLRERLVMIAPPGTNETNARRLAQTHPFIRYSPTAAVGRLIDAAIEHAGLRLEESMRLDWFDAIEAMVHHGHGISIVPERRIRSGPRYEVTQLAFGTVPFHRTLGLVEPLNSSKRSLSDVVLAELTPSSRSGRDADRQTVT